MLTRQRAFEFLDLRPSIDGELELLSPESRWIEPMYLACSDASSTQEPAAARTTRSGLGEFLRLAPLGRNRNGIPSYSFWMRLRVPPPNVPVTMAGWASLRVGDSLDLKMYLGHIGYTVLPGARGHHYAERSSRLLLNLARAHGMSRVWITCNPENAPSRRTCERLGCTFADIVPVPAGHPLYERGEHFKCRYYVDL